MLEAYGADQYPHSVSIAGRFELRERIGKGSYGTVFLAQNHELDREVAVKVMRRGDPLVAEREGKLLAQLEHPNIVAIHDHGSHDDYRWLVLELLDGPTLKAWCTGRSAREIVARYLEAGAGLDAAHRRGMVHRDFKPENIRLDKEGKAVVLDFGLARNLESLEGDAAPPTHVYGTFAYLPPEALRGQRAGEAGDQFAFCVSLWEALSGVNPFAFEGRDMQARARAIGAEPRGGSEIPRRLRSVLRRGMAVLPGERWPTMTRLLEALEQGQRGRRWSWVFAGVGVFGLVVSSLVTLAGISGATPAIPSELFELARAELNVVRTLEAQGNDEALQALRDGYSLATRRKREAEFVGFAVAVAEYLEVKGKPSEVAEAWMMVSRLAEESAQLKLVLISEAKVAKLLEQLRETPSLRNK